MWALTPKISWMTTTAPRGLPAGGASQALNSWPSRAMRVVNSLIGMLLGQTAKDTAAVRSAHDGVIAPAVLRLVQRTVRPLKGHFRHITHAKGRNAAGGGNCDRPVAEVEGDG